MASRLERDLNALLGGAQESETPPVAETGGASESRAQRASDPDYKPAWRRAQVFDCENLNAYAKITALALLHLMRNEDEIAVTLDTLAEMTGASARADSQPGTTRNIYRAGRRWTQQD